jgi:hypothetical protein
MMTMKLHTLSVAISTLLLSASVYAADAAPSLEGFWNQSFAPGTEADILRSKLPADAILINDAGGLELGEGDFGGLELSDSAKAEVAAYDFKDELSREFACNVPLVVLNMQAPFPFDILQDQKLIVMRLEYFDMVRIIFMDGRPHPPADAPHSKAGHSVGHWEGDELVVDTTHLASGSFMNNGFSHSEDLHLIERFRLSTDGNTLYATQLSEDPSVFAGKAARLVTWRKGNDYIWPYECDPSFGDLDATE